MRKIRTGFKVVHRRNGSFESAFRYICKYEVNTWTHQPEKHGPLAVFDRLCDVDQFLANNAGLATNWDVFLCEYEESFENELYTPYGRMYGSMLPQGTAFAKRVKLIKKIKNL